MLKKLMDTKGTLDFIAQEAFLPVERIVEIRNSLSPYPNPEEIIGLARALEIKPEVVEKLINDHYEKK